MENVSRDICISNYSKYKWLNALSKRHNRLTGYKNKTHISAVYKKRTSDLKTHIDWQWEDGKKIFHGNGRQKRARVAILILDKKDLKIKKITRDKEGHYKMIKGSIQEEDTTIINICASNIGAPQYIRQTLTDIKGETDNTIIIGDFNTSLTPKNRSSKQY